MHAYTHSHTHKYNGTTKGSWPGSWHSALSSLYLDYIFMYFYFLGSAYRWFPKWCEWCEFRRAWLSCRIEDVPSQSFMDGANRSHRNEEVETGALWKIQRSTDRNTTTDNGPHLSRELHLRRASEYFYNNNNNSDLYLWLKSLNK